MLTVLTPDEALELISRSFSPLALTETVALADAPGRVLAVDIKATEYVPGFDRSTVDGYAIHASDSFGCSDSIPALLTLSRVLSMGEGSGEAIEKGCCAYVPTGAALPPGCDAVAMIEYCEDFGDGTIALSKPAAPGENLIFKGDDLWPGKLIIPAGRRLLSRDIGTLASMGLGSVEVVRKPLVGIISTGDELVDTFTVPAEGQVRDVNSPMLSAMMEEFGADVISFGIVRDEEALLSSALDRALQSCDCVLISGGSSVGTKDATGRIIEARGEMLFHGLSIKPGKPTILGRVGNKPVFGLPGHPGAAWFVSRVFVRSAIDKLCGRLSRPISISARLTESVSANHGRAQYVGAELFTENGIWKAQPLRSKSGLVSSLSSADGFFCIPRDCEGYAAGDEVQVILYSTYQEV